MADKGEDEPNGERESASFVRSFARGLDVILAFGREHGAMTLTEIAGEAGVSPSAARRLLLTLVELGYVEQTGKRFRLLPKAMTLGLAYLQANDWSGVILPYLTRATSILNETTAAAVLDGTDIVHIVRSPAPGIMKFNFSVGQRFPAYATSMGRVLLAALPEDELAAFLDRAELVRRTEQTIHTPQALRDELLRVRADGYAFVDQELEEGLISLAVPVASRSGRVVAAINVTVYSGRVSRREMVDHALAVLQEAASDIGACLND